jgi:predicted nucleic-acid-binding protein
MIAVDTNIFVRYFAEDDPAQTALARQFLETVASPVTPAFVSLVTLVELLWVLKDTYKTKQEMLDEIVRELVVAPNIVLEAVDLVLAALGLENGDVADRIIHLIGKANGCSKTVTFDKKFARLKGVELLA